MLLLSVPGAPVLFVQDHSSLKVVLNLCVRQYFFQEMEDYSESQTGKLSRKIAENPFMPIGLAGLIMACGYGAYQFKNRGKMSTSVYLMQLRVGAQGAVVGTLALGVAYTIIKEHVLKKNE